MTTMKLVTIADLEQLTVEPGRYDLIRGELIHMPPAGGYHGEYALNIVAPLWNFVRAHQLGKVYTAETGFILARNPDVLVAPEGAFVRTDRLPLESEQHRFLEVAPDLVVEVISPSDRARDVLAKVMEYLDAGTAMLVLVEPRRRIVTVYSPDRTARVLGIDDTLDGGDVLPGFRLAIRDIFGA